jgi:hypothetical protein
MRKLVCALAAAAAISALPLGQASAVTLGGTAGLQSAASGLAAVQDVRYVCRHRYYSSRRVCWWEPSYRRPWWPYRRPWRRRW